jgi:hypothetical protein
MMYKKCQAGVQKMHTCLSICDFSCAYSDMAWYLLKNSDDIRRTSMTTIPFKSNEKV